MDKMKQQTLPTLSDYVNKVRYEVNAFDDDKLSLIFGFTDKIMQQPHISNFIPCVEENGVWLVLENPKNKIYPASMSCSDQINKEFDQYQTALSKVLFSGWELEQIVEGYSVQLINKEKNSRVVFWDSGRVLFEYLHAQKDNIKTLNDLTTLYLPLTETGVIEFNLKF